MLQDLFRLFIDSEKKYISPEKTLKPTGYQYNNQQATQSLQQPKVHVDTSDISKKERNQYLKGKHTEKVKIQTAT